ncbi:DNA alkylation repair protein [Sulfurimonas sp. HSL-3221]|uniref:DNA alkylation repair protein n=1 Tax=Thiomicrolovo sulfuroxydans TaxID=2894755 RepID=UPI001E4D191F|nr:DNA alkylation repair protein [Sulfurimonas sp. HSL-3221]UFS61501.1 DNA alkylation repair protein [Sulfurimonas sp. HSL-3221]
MNAEQISLTLRNLGDPDIAEHSQRFFKTGEGEYGAGDRFLGIRVPVLRKQVSAFWLAPLQEVEKLLHSPYHEERLFALLLMVAKYERGDTAEKEAVYNCYMANTAHINNWDLVDSSAPYIVGEYLIAREKAILYTFARSESLWERRIAIMATFYFIRNSRFDTALEIAELLLRDTHDLIHKAVGWMLREVGNRDPERERAFLASRYKTMPRTMLHYAIEKFPEAERKAYLKGEV